MYRLKDRRALITGGTTGIGLETARPFLCKDARLAITGRNPATLDAARRELGADVLIIPSGASEVAAQKTVAETPRQVLGGLDVLFLNAGVTELKPVEQWDERVFDRSVTTHVKGPYFLNTSVCGATKAALLSLARTLSGELLSRGIRVNAVSPGPISTPRYGKLGLSEADLKTVASSVPSQVPVGRELMIDGGMGNI